jgi:glycosyltransferase involved in cell wall biosynthesis
MSAVIRETAADVVHTNSLAGVTTGVWSASASCGVPVVHTLHDYYLQCVRTSLTRRDGTACPTAPLYCGLRAKRLLRYAQHVSNVIGVSQAVLDRHAHAFAGTESSVIRHPLVPGAQTPAPAIPPRTLGYLGRLEREKGIDFLLAAAKDGLRIRIAGSGRERRRVENAGREGLVDYVGVVHGAEKAAFLAGCDAGIVPSTWLEPGGPPYTVLEWLGAGRPVLVSPIGGLREAADDYAGVVAFDPTTAGLTTALTAAVPPPPVVDRSDFERWLDEHEAVYAAARR